MLTEIDYNTLKPYETQLKTSQVGYIRGLYSKDVKILRDVCSHYNIKLNNPNCSSCVLGAVKQLAKLYFEFEQMSIQKPKLKTKKTNNIKK